MNELSKPAKQLVLSALLCSALAAQVTCAEDQPTSPAIPGQKSPAQSAEQSPLQKFDLDFPGGRPSDLVSAIEKSTGKPLNVIISKEDQNVEIPAMKFKGITIPDLFRALTMSSQRQQVTARGSYTTSYTFDTQGQGENAIFYFKCYQPPPSQKFCRFYQLAEVLQNYSIQDITTAIQTGWKMLGVKSPPELKFHPETKLLIAVGQPEYLAIIDDVLRGLHDAPTALAGSPKKDAPPAK